MRSSTCLCLLPMPPLRPPPPPLYTAQLLRLLRPKVLVPLLNADLDQEGGLVPLMSTAGSSRQEDVEALLGAAGLGGVKVDYPAPPGESLAIAL